MTKLYHRLYILFGLLFFLSRLNVAYGQAPTITSLLPQSGEAGTLVTISGNNFSTNLSDNIVYFGAARGILSMASATKIKVYVPSGATYAPITVTTNGLTAYSSKPFLTTFPSSGDPLNSGSFKNRVDYPVDFNPTFTAIQDLNDDGKADFMSTNAGAGNVSVCKNTSTISITSFAAHVNVQTGSNPFGVAFGDLDGDGKPDAAISNGASNTVSVLTNTSSGATVSFSPKMDFPTGTYPRSVVIQDIDTDGKPDIVVANYDFGLTGSISILRNTSSIGSISFEPKVDFTTGSSPVMATVGDLDLDGMPDIAISNINSNNISVLRNTSSIGTFSFGPRLDLPAGTSPWGIAIGDLNLDGWPEMVVTNQYSSSVSIFENLSSPGSISFDTPLDITTGSEPINVSIGNIDGDSRPDLAISNYGENTVSLLRNLSNSGSLAFDSKMDYQTDSHPISASIGDFNFDGKPDLAVGNYLANNVSIFSNQVDVPVITSFTPTAAVEGSVITITGYSFTDATAVQFGGVNADTFIINSPNQITAILGSGATGVVTVTTPYGTASLAGFKVYGIPTITSFSPVSGLPGTVVTITGNNFSSTAANNIVYFGPVKATVSSATTTNIVATVPYGANFQPITVTLSGLTAISSKPFNVTFPGAGPKFTSTSFAPKVDFSTGSLSYPLALAISDINVDGKSDLVSVNLASNKFSVFKNTSATLGAISFASRSDFTTGQNPIGLAVKDLDGDGKQDVATVNSGEASVSVFRNTSSGAFISFSPSILFSTEDSASAIAVGDLDGDARPEMVTVNPLFASFSVFVNTSLPAAISFDDKVDFSSVILQPNSLTLADIDGDKKQDVIVTYFHSNVTSVFRNTSTIGNISFAPQINLTVGSDPVSVVAGDLDGDGKPEIVVSNSNSATVSILRNISTPGSIGFVSKVDLPIGVDFNAGLLASGIAICDLDGDGKPDIAAENNADDSLLVFKNNCTLGTISFLTRVGYNSAFGPSGIVIGDLDNDGKPDIETSNVASNLSVLKNGYLDPTVTSFSPTSSGTGATITITGTNFTGASAVSFGGTPAASFTVVSATTITAVVAVGSSGGITVITPTGTATKNGYTYVPSPTLTSFTPTNGGAGTSVTIIGTNLSGTTAVSFGGTPATSFSVSSSTLMTAVVSSGASGDVSVTTPGGTAIHSGFVWFPLPVVTSFSPASAGNGDTVTITGTNFTGGTAVKFGTRAATSFTVISSTEIRAVVGTGLSGTVAVTTPGGTGSLAGFTWVPAPVVSGFAPTSGGFGTVVTISGSNFTGATDVTFGGSPASAFTVVSSTSITATVGAGSTGSVAVTTVGGTGTRSGFTWFPVPVITSFSPMDAGPGITVTLTGSGFTGATGVTFGGFAGTSLVVVNATTITVKVPASGASGSVAVTTPGGTGSLSGFTWVPAPTITSFTPTSGGPGFTVTITGTNLTGATAVKFGAANATSFTVDSPTTITAIVSTGASGSVSVTTSGGTATLAGFVFIPAPTLTSFTPVNAGPGMSVSLTGTNFSGTTNVNFGGTPATSFTVVSSTSITAVVGAGSSGSISVTTGGGTGSKTGFTWYPTPTITSFTPASGGLGTVVTITGTDFTGATAVKFGGTNASLFTVVSPTTITATVSTGTSGSVTVTTPGGTATKAGFTWIAAPTITSFTPTSSGNGLTVSITGTNFTTTTAISFGGTPALSFTVVSATSITAVVGSGSTGSVSVTTLGGTATRTGFTWYPMPTITSFTPTDAGTGTTVTITGTNFTGATSAKFGGVTGTSFTVVNSTTITVKVGSGGASGNVSVTNPAGTTSLAGFTYYPVPTVTACSPMMAGIGDTVVLTGTGFTGATIVRFGLVNATWYSVDSPTQITAIISTGNSGNAAVITPGGTGFIAGFVFISAPTITSFTPVNAGNGTTVTITGTNFTTASAVNFGGVPATSFTVVSATSISAVVGSGASGSVSVTTIGGTATRSGFNWFPAPAISSFTPAIGGTGTNVTITGTNFTGATSVTFGGIAGTFLNVINSTTITVNVGIGGASGDVVVTTPGGSATMPGFTWFPAPTITSFTPTSGGAGATITITGTNFTNTSAVKFGGTNAASFTVDSPTSITAILSSGASGSVSVTTPGGTALLGGFTFIQPPAITSFTPTVAGSGTTITITGTNLTGATIVTFGGAAPTSFTVVNATTITAVLGSGASGDVLVTTPGGTATLAGFTHNGMRPAHDDEDLQTQVYPNPFQNRFNLSFQSEKAGQPVELKICNLSGRIVQTQSATTIEGTNTLEVNIENEASGMLLLHLQKGAQAKRIQVIKK